MSQGSEGMALINLLWPQVTNDVKHHSKAQADDRQGKEEGEGNAVGNVQSVLKRCCIGV